MTPPADATAPPVRPLGLPRQTPPPGDAALLFAEPERARRASALAKLVALALALAGALAGVVGGAAALLWSMALRSAGGR